MLGVNSTGKRDMNDRNDTRAVKIHRNTPTSAKSPHRDIFDELCATSLSVRRWSKVQSRSYAVVICLSTSQLRLPLANNTQNHIFRTELDFYNWHLYQS